MSGQVASHTNKGNWMHGTTLGKDSSLAELFQSKAITKMMSAVRVSMVEFFNHKLIYRKTNWFIYPFTLSISQNKGRYSVCIGFVAESLWKSSHETYHSGCFG